MSLASCLQLGDELLQPFNRTFELTLPNDMAVPAGSFQCGKVSLVAIDVLPELPCPELRSCLGGGSIAAARVSMPEAAVHENASFPLWQDNVWSSRQVLPVKPEAVPASMEEFANSNLRLRISPGYPAHHPRSCGCIDNVHPIPLLVI